MRATVVGALIVCGGIFIATRYVMAAAILGEKGSSAGVSMARAMDDAGPETWFLAGLCLALAAVIGGTPSLLRWIERVDERREAAEVISKRGR